MDDFVRYDRDDRVVTLTLDDGNVNALGTEMLAAVGDSMIDEFAAAGTPAEVDERLRRYDGVVDEVVLSVPSFQVPAERVAENLALLTESCARP